MMAWYSLTLKKLGAIGKIPKTLLGENVREVVKNFADYVQARLVALKKQNEQVYHDRIPDTDTLEPISGMPKIYCSHVHVEVFHYKSVQADECLRIT